VLKLLVQRELRRAEQARGVPLDYVKYIVGSSWTGFRRFMKFVSISNARTMLPKESYHVLRLAVTQLEDCGSCLQVEINDAKKAGLDDATIEAVLKGRRESLADEQREVFDFAQALHKGEDLSPLRAQLKARYGDQGLVDVALVVAVCRVFPTIKRVLGFSGSDCAS
jgi:AhpD family alkylhydroperoxidase